MNGDLGRITNVRAVFFNGTSEPKGALSGGSSVTSPAPERSATC